MANPVKWNCSMSVKYTTNFEDLVPKIENTKFQQFLILTTCEEINILDILGYTLYESSCHLLLLTSYCGY